MRTLLISLITVFATWGLQAQDKLSVRKQHFNFTEGTPAIKGYELVDMLLVKKLPSVSQQQYHYLYEMWK